MENGTRALGAKRCSGARLRVGSRHLSSILHPGRFRRTSLSDVYTCENLSLYSTLLGHRGEFEAFPLCRHNGRSLRSCRQKQISNVVLNKPLQCSDLWRNIWHRHARTYTFSGYIGFCRRLMRMVEQWRLRGQYCVVCARHSPPLRERHESLDVLAPDLSDYRRDLWKAVSISTTRPFSGSRIDVV